MYGNRNPVPDGVECPRPEQYAPGCVECPRLQPRAENQVARGECRRRRYPQEWLTCCGIPVLWKRGMGVGSRWMMDDASRRHLPPEHLCPCRGGRSWEEVRAVSKPRGRRTEVRKGKVTARKVSEVLNAVARLIRAVGVLVDALSKWIG